MNPPDPTPTSRVLVLQLPSPPLMNVKRDYAGGMGVADPSTRNTYGHDEGYITLPYMSLLYSAAILERDGHRVTFVDGQAERLDQERLFERVRLIEPDVLLCAINLPSFHGDLEILRALKRRFPAVQVIVIGTVSLGLFKEVADSRVADVVLRGDPEPLLAEVLHQLGTRVVDQPRFLVKEGVLTNRDVSHIEDLDSLPPFPYHLTASGAYWYHVFGKQVRYVPMFSSRGCSYRCYYCPYPVGFGGSIVYRDPVKVVDEIEALNRRHGVTGILFRDQIFTFDHAHAEAICDELIARGTRIEWVVETRLDRVNEALLRKMKAAGCKRVHYGLESGDPELFEKVGKDRAAAKMGELVKNYALTEKLGLGAHLFILIGLIGESWETIRHTIQTIGRIKPLTLQVSVVTPYPGTGLFDEAKRKKLLVTENWAEYSGFRPVMRTQHLSEDDLLRARNLIIREHEKAVYLKRCAHRLTLAGRYVLDGTIVGRLGARLTRRAF